MKLQSASHTVVGQICKETVKECGKQEGIRIIGVKHFIAVHHRNQIISFGEVDNVVGVAGEHMDDLNVISKDLPFQHLAFRIIEVTLQDEAVAFHYNKLLKLGVVPMPGWRC